MDTSDVYKIILCGESNVGKTTLFHWLRDNEYVAPGSVCTDDVCTTIYTSGTRTFKFQLWDTMGHERYNSLTQSYFRNAVAAIYVYSVDSTDSLLKLQYFEKKVLREDTEQNKVMRFIVGNKTDLEENVSPRDAKGKCLQYNCIFKEPMLTSAKRGDGVLTMFETIARRVDENLQNSKKQQTQKKKNRSVDLSANNTRKARGCCK